MKISYLITLYNKSETIKIVVEQILKDIKSLPAKISAEIIIVDDGSTDDSLQIAQSLQKKYPELIKLYCQKNQGVVAATSKAIELAKGDWLRFVDADDLVIIGSTNYLIELGKKYNAVAILSQPKEAFHVKEISNKSQEKYDVKSDKEPFLIKNAVRTSLRYTLAITSGIVIKSKVASLIKMNPKIRYAQDHYLIALASYHGNILQSNCGSFLYCHGMQNSLAKNYLEMVYASFEIGLDVLKQNKSTKKDFNFFANFSARRLARAIRKKYGKKIFVSGKLFYYFTLMTILGRTNLIKSAYKIQKIDTGYKMAIKGMKNENY